MTTADLEISLNPPEESQRLTPTEEGEAPDEPVLSPPAAGQRPHPPGAAAVSPRYSLELRYTTADDSTDDRYRVPAVMFPTEKLRQRELNPSAYGKLLCKSLFADGGAMARFHAARTHAEKTDSALRVRLAIGAQVAELHGLRWEMLGDPDTGHPLFLGDRILFSRYLSSRDYRPVRLRGEDRLRALVAIANPSNLSAYGQVPTLSGRTRSLDPIDVPREKKLVQDALRDTADIDIDWLDEAGPVTLAALCDRLERQYDVVHLVCHGALIKGESVLYLENADRTVDAVRGNRLVEQLGTLQKAPRLVVLASCQSAGHDREIRTRDEGALAALGPKLAVLAGVPAVLALQGNTAMRTVQQFLSVFYQKLRPDWQVDRAVGLGRRAVSDHHDSWKPVLFMRLKNGCLWRERATPQPTQRWPGFKKWPALLDNIYRDRCTPILGPGLLEALVGPFRQLARDWAERHDFPLAAHWREDLAHVSEYLATVQQPTFPRDRLEDHILGKLRESVHGRPAAAAGQGQADALLSAVARERRRSDPADPHRVLARLPCKLYLSTNPDRLLRDALEDAGKRPQVDYCQWRDDVAWPAPLNEQDPSFRLSPDEPLVYHFFGGFALKNSLVLTADDYFDFLIGATMKRDSILKAVIRALADSALLYLGFRVDDWSFKVLFRCLVNKHVGEVSKGYAHVAVQVDPDTGGFTNPGQARDYLGTYYLRQEVSIIWCPIEEFMQQLQQRLE
jgi:hypothetical protein